MSSDEDFLQELINRITNPNSSITDELATQMVCTLVLNNCNVVKKCSELLAMKIRSENEPEVLKALDLLEECMAKCGPLFQKRISRFQFLNELVRLVSEKYDGLKTSKEIRHKIMNLLLLWTTLYPDKENIKKTYDALPKEGIQQPQSTPASDTYQVKQNYLMSQEEEKILKLLLQSKDKDDIKKANLLIQSFVNRDIKQNEKKALINNKLQEIKTVTSLLNQVIDRWTEEKQQTESQDDFTLMKELYDMCNRFKPELAIMPEIIDEGEVTTLAEAIDVNESLLDVLNKCSSIISNVNSGNSIDSNASENSQSQTVERSDDLLSGFLEESNPSTSCTTENPLDDLAEIFTEQPKLQDKYNVTDFQLLEPTTALDNSMKKVENSEANTKSTPKKSLHDIDKISEDLLKANVKNGELIRNFKKEPKKVSLIELAKEKPILHEGNVSSENHSDTTPVEQLTIFDKLISEISEVSNKSPTIETTTTELCENSAEHNLNDIIKKPEVLEAQGVIKEETKENITTCEKQLYECVKHLSDINLDFNEIEVAKETPRKIMFNSDLQVTINFALNKPSLHVCVLVISAVNQSQSPVENYHLIASVRRPCKLRTLPPTNTNLPGVEPLKLPTVDIRQLLLLYNPTKEPVNITFIIEYTLGNDPDPIKESIIVENIPYNFE